MAPQRGAFPGVRIAPALLVTLAAVLWGTDALIRRPLSLEIDASTLVLAEHAILVACVAHRLPGAWARAWAAGWRAVGAMVLVGAGASALATVLFTQAFTHGDPVAPVVLQKLQPLVAVIGGALLLGERPRRSFGPLLLLSLVGAWLLSFPQPLEVSAGQVQAAAEAVGAAVLWGLGTVLGRAASRDLVAEDVTALRFGFGLPAAAVIVLLMGAPALPGTGDWVAIALLALIPGLLAMRLYYAGLQHTPATMATVLELAFPLTAALVGVLAFDAQLTGGQWAGAAILVAAVLAMNVRPTRSLVRVPWRAGREGSASVEPGPA
jgi:drug/metabolite transporter, DME family